MHSKIVASLAKTSASKIKHPLALGPTEDIPFFKKQTRLTFARCGLTDPVSLADYKAHGGYKGLERTLAIKPIEIVEEVTKSGLRGRGGAGFPTGIKWKTVHDTPMGQQKYIVCNADEGDSGTFADRMIMEGDPFVLIEGMTIAGIAVGATKGYIYLRSEYPHAQIALNQAIAAAKNAGLLGKGIAGSPHTFDIEVRMGAGAYVCGEETSLLESLEGKRGLVRAKPPLPAHKGLFGQPTVINNVLSLSAVPYILSEGAKAYYDYGMGRSRGTMPIQLAGNIKHGGLFETAFGITLGELVDDIGGGTASGRPVKAVQVGGPLGRISRAPTSIRRSTTKPSQHATVSSAMPASWSSTTRPIWPSRLASPFISVQLRAAESARPAASVRRAAARPWTRSSPARTARPTSPSSKTFATR